MQLQNSSNFKSPTLRFSGFDESWNQVSLGKVSENPMYGMNAASKAYDGKNIYLRITDVDDSTGRLKRHDLTSPDAELNDDYLLRENDLLFTRTGASTGKAYLYKESDGIVYFAGFLIKFSIEKADPKFVYFSTLTSQYWKWVKTVSMRSGQPGINAQEYSKYKFYIPELPEQNKITSFLSSIDEWIENLRLQKDSIEKYKKGMMQKILSQQIRFKDENGKDFPEWEEKSFGDVFDRITEKNLENNKNVLTISAQYGLINQEDFFNKSVAANNLLGYSILQKGDFAYNKSYSNGYPMGAIKKLNIYDKGVVSSLYICFRTKKGNSSEFYEQYFNSGMQNREIEKIAQEGARNHGLLNISVVDFFVQLFLQVPSYPEQQKIAEFLISIDELISQKSNRIKYAEQWKKGLIQKMFI